MQEVATQAQNLSFSCHVADCLFAARAIGGVADYRMPDVSHVNADLVSAARLDLNIQQGELLESRSDFEDRMRRTPGAAAQDGHPRSIAAAAPDTRLHFTVRNRKLPIHESYVGFADLALAELIGQSLMRQIILGDNQQT